MRQRNLAAKWSGRSPAEVALVSLSRIQKRRARSNRACTSPKYSQAGHMAWQYSMCAVRGDGQWSDARIRIGEAEPCGPRRPVNTAAAAPDAIGDPARAPVDLGTSTESLLYYPRQRLCTIRINTVQMCACAWRVYESSAQSSGPNTTHAVQNCGRVGQPRSERDRGRATHDVNAPQQQPRVFVYSWSCHDRFWRVVNRDGSWMGEEDPNGVEGDSEEMAEKGDR
jgi:hypothetical protein